MSRCCAFPPPGYEKNGLTGEDLLQWFKKSKERVLAKKEKKKAKKREKEKGKKVDFKENLGIGKSDQNHEKNRKDESSDGIVDNEGHMKRQKDERIKAKGNDDHGDYTKVRDHEAEQDEKSDITEERGQPNIDQKVYESSGSTQNSNKRNFHSLSSDGSVHDQDVPLSMKSSCSPSGKTEIISHGKAEIVPTQEQLCSISGRTDNQCQHNAKPSHGTNFLQGCYKELDAQFRELIEKWVPPPLLFECGDFEDMGWLFKKTQHHGHIEKRFKASPALWNEGPSLFPHACYLPELDLHMLPYTVPY